MATWTIVLGLAVKHGREHVTIIYFMMPGNERERGRAQGLNVSFEGIQAPDDLILQPRSPP